jgi:hypothetical protein
MDVTAARRVHERIVLGDRPVVIEPVHLPQRARQVLGAVWIVAVAFAMVKNRWFSRSNNNRDP